MILVPLAGASRYDHTDFTPIARINTDYSIILVAADSEYQTLEDLFEALKANPGLSVGGGSAPLVLGASAVARSRPSEGDTSRYMPVCFE